MSGKTKTLVVSFSELKRDPRIYRQLLFLEEKGEVTTVGFSPPSLPVHRHITVPHQPSSLFKKGLKAFLLLLGAFQTVYWMNPTVKAAEKGLKGEKFDLIVANDLSALPLCVKIAKESGAFLYYDAHEYSPEEFNNLLLWRIFFKRYAHSLCKKYLHFPQAMTTVSPTIANLYAEHYSVQPSLITNAPPYRTLTPRKVDPQTIKILYHGAVTPCRNIESLLETAALLDPRFTLDIIAIPGCRKYIEKIKEQAKPLKNVRFIPPVPMETIPELCNQYDIGLFPCFPNELNYNHCLPNKFFELIQGRVAIATFPTEAMGEIIREFGIGVVASEREPSQMASLLNSLTADEIFAMKERTDSAAEAHSAEKNKEIFLSLCEFS